MKRTFHISDVLSITTGKLVSTRHMDGVYDILNFLTQDSLFTHQLPAACDECAPVLLAKHPELATIQVPEFTGTRTEREEAITAWLATVQPQELELEPIEGHTHSDPFADLAKLGKPIIGVVVD